MKLMSFVVELEQDSEGRKRGKVLFSSLPVEFS